MIYKTIQAQKNLSSTAMGSTSKKWLERFNEIIAISASRRPMSNLQIAEKLHMSERDLFRKVKKATGFSPQKYIRHQRLLAAKQWLINGRYRTVKATSQAAGYANTSYFIFQFEKKFGKKPLQILKEQGWR